MVFNYEDEDFYITCEEQLNKSNDFSVSIRDKDTQALIANNDFFKNKNHTMFVKKLNIHFVLFEKQKVLQFYKVYMIALL